LNDPQDMGVYGDPMEQIWASVAWSIPIYSYLYFYTLHFDRCGPAV
jgi:hypothetical protein